MSRLKTSILFWVTCSLCIQSFFFFTSTRLFSKEFISVHWQWWAWIIITHILLLTFFFVRIHDFIILNPRTLVLHKVNLANILTLLRLTSAPILHYLIIASTTEKNALLGILTFWVLASVSDLFDGMLARKNQITKIGQYLDPMADYYILTSASLALVLVRLLSLWLVMLIMIRLIFQGIIAIYMITKQNRTMHSTIIGKMLIFAVFCLYNFSLLTLFERTREIIQVVRPYFEAAVAIILLISLYERTRIFFFPKQQDRIKNR